MVLLWPKPPISSLNLQGEASRDADGEQASNTTVVASCICPRSFDSLSGRLTLSNSMSKMQIEA